MQLSKPGYYADFFIYPPLIVGLAGVTLVAGAPFRPYRFLALCLAGFAAWTLLEYLLHRYVLHEVPGLHDMHEEHHRDPTALAGTPSWLSLVLLIVSIYLPLWWWLGFQVASPITAGLMIGYLWYIVVHHITHHWRLEPGTHLYQLKHRHARHHFSKVPGNFGVSTIFWDLVFRTNLDRLRTPSRGKAA